jgi:hypothetical protein
MTPTATAWHNLLGETTVTEEGFMQLGWRF